MIGIIDSGTGGLNVVLECTKYYNEDFVYLLDNKNCPYGNKSIKVLKQILIDNINYLIKNYDIDLIIIACNTISTLIDYSLMLEYKTPILKTVPKIQNIKNNGKNILVFATKNTIKNSKELKLIKFNYKDIKTLQIYGLPKLIDQFLSDKSSKNRYKIKRLLNYYFLKNPHFKINSNLDELMFIKKSQNKIIKNKQKQNMAKGLQAKTFFSLHKNQIAKKYNSVEYISLGCTHFKHIKNHIKNTFNGNINFFECETEVAKNSKWLIRKSKKLSTLNLILTKKDQELEKVVYELFNRLKTKVL